jgi:hypothetical protein
MPTINTSTQSIGIDSGTGSAERRGMSSRVVLSTKMRKDTDRMSMRRHPLYHTMSVMFWIMRTISVAPVLHSIVRTDLLRPLEHLTFSVTPRRNLLPCVSLCYQTVSPKGPWRLILTASSGARSLHGALVAGGIPPITENKR